MNTARASANLRYGRSETAEFNEFEKTVHGFYVKGRRKEALALLRDYAHNGPLKNIPFVKNRILADREIIEKKTFLTSRPTSLRVPLTTRCNLRCIMCPFHEKPWDIPLRAVREIADLLPYLKNLQWYGGEAFLSKHFEPLFDKACGYPFLCQRINTNGLLFTKQWVKKAVLNGTGVDLSIDGFTKETYEYIRKGGDFSRLQRNLELLAEYREKYATSAPRRMELTLSCIVMHNNYDDLDGILDFAAKYGIDKIILNKLGASEYKPGFFLIENIIGNPAMRKNIFRKIDRIQKCAPAYGIVVDDHVPRDKVQYPYRIPEYSVSPAGKKKALCHAPWRQLCINPSGTITPHCYCDKSVGMIQRDSLLGAWNGGLLRNYRKYIVQGRYTPACPVLCSSGYTRDDLEFLHM